MMRFQLSALFSSLCLASLAIAQAGAPDDIHVPPPTTREGVRISLNPSGKVPSSPEAAKMLADLIAANGVDVQPEVPWHAVLSYDEFDEDGDNVHSGTIEEFYASARKYRKIIKTDEFSQIEVANGTDLYRAGDQSWPPQATLQALNEVLWPLSGASLIPQASPDKLDWTIGKTTLPCVALRNGQVISPNGLPKFCYDPGSTLLRYTRGRGWDETVYNNILQFKGRYLAHDVEVAHAGKPFLKIHLATIESVPQTDGSLFLPPEGSSGPVRGPIKVPSGQLVQLPVSRFPSFPRGIHGKVTVAFTLDKTGHVEKATAIDGPEELRKPAEEAVKGFQFKPFILLGQPIEVESTMFYEIH